MKPPRRWLFVAMLAVVMPWAGHSQNLTDIGTANPLPGTNDIFQSSTNGNQQLTGAFNYFTDNVNPPGQTFMPGTDPLVLSAVTVSINQGHQT